MRRRLSYRSIKPEDVKKEVRSNRGLFTTEDTESLARHSRNQKV